jgi:hypothetical protein
MWKIDPVKNINGKHSTKKKYCNIFFCNFRDRSTPYNLNISSNLKNSSESFFENSAGTNETLKAIFFFVDGVFSSFTSADLLKKQHRRGGSLLPEGDLNSLSDPENRLVAKTQILGTDENKWPGLT